jgi:hypothetical protein
VIARVPPAFTVTLRAQALRQSVDAGDAP